MENTHTTHETPLQAVKIGVWCAVTHHSNFEPVFFENAINLEHNTDTDHEFLRHLAEEWFQQGRATCHTVWIRIVEKQLLEFTATAMDEQEWSASHPSHFSPEKWAPCTQCL
jgi:hypothetical protein